MYQQPVDVQFTAFYVSTVGMVFPARGCWTFGDVVQMLKISSEFLVM